MLIELSPKNIVVFCAGNDIYWGKTYCEKVLKEIMEEHNPKIYSAIPEYSKSAGDQKDEEERIWIEAQKEWNGNKQEVRNHQNEHNEEGNKQEVRNRRNEHNEDANSSDGETQEKINGD